MANLSELEHVVLGIVWKFGPLTAYAVRKEFLTSPSSHFSGSAGAIYPLMKRLEERGMISSSSVRRGKRTRFLYKIAADGTAALRAWLHLSLPEKSSVLSYNPLRARFYFLKALSPKERSEFVVNAKIMVKEEIARVKSRYGFYIEKGDPFSRLASRNGILALTSQLKWIGEIEENMDAM